MDERVKGDELLRPYVILVQYLNVRVRGSHIQSYFILLG